MRVKPPLSRNSRASRSRSLSNSRRKRAHSSRANKTWTLQPDSRLGPGKKRPNVVAWRRARLCHAGFDPALAEALSREPGVDLHALTGLVERGCPPPLAARILAPLDYERRAY